MTLAPRQQQTLAYIADHTRREGIAPTYREIGDALGIRSTNGVSDHVKALVRKRCLKRNGSGHARAITLTDKGRALLVSDDPERLESAARDLLIRGMTILIDLHPPNVALARGTETLMDTLEELCDMPA